MLNPVHSEALEKKNYEVTHRLHPTATPASCKLLGPQRPPTIPRKETYIAAIAIAAILTHLLLRYVFRFSPLAWQIPA